MAENSAAIRDLMGIGLSETKAKETLKNEAVSKSVLAAIAAARPVLSLRPGDAFPKTIGNLLYHVGTKTKPRIADRIPLLARYVAEGHIDGENRLNAALAFLMEHLAPELNMGEFDAAIGKGVVVTSADIEETISKLIAQHRDELVALRYSFPVGKLLASARELLKFGDGKDIKNELDVQVGSPFNCQR
jgi:glutaminyl-tRNA synthetase